MNMKDVFVVTKSEKYKNDTITIVSCVFWRYSQAKDWALHCVLDYIKTHPGFRVRVNSLPDEGDPDVGVKTILGCVHASDTATGNSVSYSVWNETILGRPNEKEST